MRRRTDQKPNQRENVVIAFAVACGVVAILLGIGLSLIAKAQTSPPPAIIEVHDPDRGVYTITGYGDLIIYNGDGLFVEMHTDADMIFHNGFDGQ